MADTPDRSPAERRCDVVEYVHALTQGLPDDDGFTMNAHLNLLMDDFEAAVRAEDEQRLRTLVEAAHVLKWTSAHRNQNGSYVTVALEAWNTFQAALASVGTEGGSDA